MPYAIQVHQTGAPENLIWEEVPLAELSPKEVRVRHTAIGVNYIDIYHRNGTYPLKTPFIPGMEAAGVIEAVGAEISQFAVGDRVAYGKGPIGAYCEYRNINSDMLIKLPPAIDDGIAAAGLLRGLTVHFLVRKTFSISPHVTILVHAAAGGVGLLLCQWAKLLGANVIGTVSSDEKAELAKNNGCDVVINYKKEDVLARVKKVTSGMGVNVVYDGVGRDTFFLSLDCLMPLGLLVSYGQSSGVIPAFSPQELQKRGSLFFTRPNLIDYVRAPEDYLIAASEFFSHLLEGSLQIHVGQTFWLNDAASAHRALEAGTTTGSTILFPLGW